MLRTRSEEVDYILLHRAIFGEFPTREVVDAALPVTNWAALIEKLYESQQYDGVDVPGLDRYEPPAPEPEPEPQPEPEPDPGPPPRFNCSNNSCVYGLFTINIVGDKLWARYSRFIQWVNLDWQPNYAGKRKHTLHFKR